MNLEEEYKKLIESTFDTLRIKYMERDLSKEDADELQKMLVERLGMEDPNGELPEAPWVRSSWCSGG